VETRTKERLTGALILVALFVILVPELLSGRSQRGSGDAVPEARPASEGPPLVTYRMPLDGGAEAVSGQGALNVQPSQQADHLPPPVPTTVTHEAPSAAAPALGAPAPKVEASPEPVPAPADNKPIEKAAEKPAKVVPAKAVPPRIRDDKPEKAIDKGWFVQLGVFSRRENAEQLARQLGNKGQAAHITGSGSALRVRVGPVADRAAALTLKKRLAADGFTGTLVPP
jgi:cell division septation protein DedD